MDAETDGPGPGRSMTITPRAMGLALDRVDGPDKVRGTARHAWEHPVPDPVYLCSCRGGR